MKRLFKIVLSGLLLALCSVTAAGANVSARMQGTDMESSYISQKEICHQTIYHFYPTYPATIREIIAGGDFYFSYPKSYICLYYSINKFREPSGAFLSAGCKEHYNIHPFPVEYYIFALKKIIT